MNKQFRNVNNVDNRKYFAKLSSFAIIEPDRKKERAETHEI